MQRAAIRSGPLKHLSPSLLKACTHLTKGMLSIHLYCTLQAVAPSTSWKVPAVQLVHLSCAVASDVYEPALQLVGDMLCVEQNAPFTHG